MSTHHDPAEAPKPKLGLSNLETAEKRRRIAELKYEIAQRQHERTTLEEELKADKLRFPR